MKFTFTSNIYKVGINPCVDVPERITKKFTPVKGYIPIEGTINRFPFYQTLVPVRDSPYRLFVNIPMMKGANVKVGDKAKFDIQQNMNPEKLEVKMHPRLKARLIETKLLDTFNQYTPSRQKEVFKYLNSLKTEESVDRNIDKVISALRKTKE